MSIAQLTYKKACTDQKIFGSNLAPCMLSKKKTLVQNSFLENYLDSFLKPQGLEVSLLKL